jgi:hypothetical protein
MLDNWGESILTAISVASRSSAACSSLCLLLPVGATLPWDPFSSRGIPFELAVLVSVSRLQELEQWVTQSRIHANRLPRMIAANSVSRQALFKEGLLVGTPTVELPRWGHSRRESASFATRIVPCAQCVPCPIQRTEMFDACIRAIFPRCLERGRLG